MDVRLYFIFSGLFGSFSFYAPRFFGVTVLYRNKYDCPNPLRLTPNPLLLEDLTESKGERQWDVILFPLLYQSDQQFVVMTKIGFGSKCCAIKVVWSNIH